MIPINRIEQSIPDMTGLTVLTIAVSAFALSFFNLQAAALQAGINPYLSWLWPVCIDALLIAGSLMILRSSLRNESPLIGWSVLLSFTAVSTAFNVLHSPDGLISQAAHAVPPVALCISIELLMVCIRSDLTSSTSDPKSEPIIVPQKSSNLVTPSTDLPTPERRRPSDVSDPDIIRIFESEPGISINRASQALGISKSAMQRRTVKLREQGRLPQPGIPDYLSSSKIECISEGTLSTG